MSECLQSPKTPDPGNIMALSGFIRNQHTTVHIKSCRHAHTHKLIIKRFFKENKTQSGGLPSKAFYLMDKKKTRRWLYKDKQVERAVMYGVGRGEVNMFRIELMKFSQIP